MVEATFSPRLGPLFRRGALRAPRRASGPRPSSPSPVAVGPPYCLLNFAIAFASHIGGNSGTLIFLIVLADQRHTKTTPHVMYKDDLGGPPWHQEHQGRRPRRGGAQGPQAPRRGSARGRRRLGCRLSY